MLVASMNPCPCGFFGSKIKDCTCSAKAVQNYINKISGPLLDRIDIQVEVTPVEYEKLQKNMNNFKEENSKTIKERVNKARKIQLERYKDLEIYSNSGLTPRLIEKYCKINRESSQILEKAFTRLNLSARAYGRILKVARTIADLEEKENIEVNHITEAIQYRNLDRRKMK